MVVHFNCSKIILKFLLVDVTNRCQIVKNIDIKIAALVCALYS